ncbi:Nem1-Spo7 complex regulatory subunit Spo7, partial [Kalaharituber pfeilii]
SSPQQIYLNLLILEASLRSQYLSLTLRRRKYTFFALLLCIWTLNFGYQIFVWGPSPYYYISLLQKLALGAGIATLGLFWLSGLYRKTMVFPRKFVGNTNKGLRQFNIKLVALSQAEEEESLQPSGSHVKLVILPKGFSPTFREGWEVFRNDYWWKENERRAKLRQQLKKNRPSR